MLPTWFKIEHFLGDGEGWRHSLFDGKPSKFGTYEAASIALRDTKQYPKRHLVGKWDHTVVYRIIEVSEKVVFDTAEEQRKKDIAEMEDREANKPGARKRD